jgi:hypothetical protein
MPKFKTTTLEDIQREEENNSFAPRTNASRKGRPRMASKEVAYLDDGHTQDMAKGPEQAAGSNALPSERQTAETGRSMVDRQLEQLEDYNYNPDSAKGDPKLYVDVNIGKQGGMERIIVYEGDTAHNLAKEFCIKNGLNVEMQDKLVLLLEQQIAGVLPKIVEGGEDENEEESQDKPNGNHEEPAQLLVPSLKNSPNRNASPVKDLSEL